MSEEFVLVTGAAGFIGAELCNFLKSHTRIVAVDNFNQQVHGVDTAVENSDVLRFDIGVDDFERLSALGTPTGIVHLAAETGTGQSMYDLENYYRTNILGTARLLDFALKHKDSIKHFLFASSRSVYGEGEYHCNSCDRTFLGRRSAENLQRKEFSVFCDACGTIARGMPTRETTNCEPVSQYALTKICNEKSVALALEPTDIKFCNFRFQNVYGIGQSLNNPYTGVLGVFATLALEGKPISVYENGVLARDFVHVSDIVKVLAQSLERSDLPTCLNIGSGTPSNLYDVALAISKYFGGRSTVSVTDAFRIGDIAANYADLSNFGMAFPDFEFCKFEEKIFDYLDWVKSAGGVDLDKFEVSVDELKSRGLFLE